MSVLMLIYHRVGAGGGSANPHHLPMSRFRDQVAHISRAGIPLLSWSEPLQTGVKPRLAITFDDGYASDLDCAQVLARAGQDALFFIATGCLGRRPYLHVDELRDLAGLGMTVGSHSHSHIQLTSLDDASLRDELVRSREMLEHIVQRPVTRLSFPGGAFDARVLGQARAAGYSELFTSDWGANRARQLRERLYRRTAVVNHLDDAQFDALIRQRHEHARRLAFMGKELVKKTFGVERYVRWRQALLELRK